MGETGPQGHRAERVEGVQPGVEQAEIPGPDEGHDGEHPEPGKRHDGLPGRALDLESRDDFFHAERDLAVVNQLRRPPISRPTSCLRYTPDTSAFPTKPGPLHPVRMTDEDVWGLTPEDLEACRSTFAGLRNEGIFTPPSIGGTLQFPSAGGGANWGSVSIDPNRAVLYVNQMHAAQLVWLIERKDFAVDWREAPRIPDRFTSPR